jgi:hypothetical protein
VKFERITQCPGSEAQGPDAGVWSTGQFVSSSDSKASIGRPAIQVVAMNAKKPPLLRNTLLNGGTTLS